MDKHFKSCINILEVLAKKPRVWGNHYEDFFYAFRKLSLDELSELKKVGNPKGKRNLMYQYVRNYIRNHVYGNRVSEMNDCFWLMWLDDFSGGDYREDILRIVTPFLAVTEEYYEARARMYFDFPFDFPFDFHPILKSRLC